MADTPVARKPRTIRTEKEKANKLVREAKKLRPGESLCSGRVKLKVVQTQPVGPDNPYLRNDDGSVQTRPCKKRPIAGGTVCIKHGGTAPQVRTNAGKRLLAMVEPSLIRLGALVQQEEHLPTALGAIRTVLERAGSRAIGPLAKEGGDGNARPIIQIGIKVGGIENPTVTVGMQLPEGAGNAEEGEIVGDDDSDDPEV